MADQKLALEEVIEQANVALVENKFKRATRILEAASENYPENTEILYMLAIAVSAQAQKIFSPIRSEIIVYQNMGIAAPDDKANKYDEELQTYILRNYRAIDYLDKAVKINKDDARAYAQRAILKYSIQDHPANIVNDCEAALKLNTDVMRVYYIRGAVYYSQDKYEEAITDFKTYMVKENDEFSIIEAADALKQAKHALAHKKAVTQREQNQTPWWKFW